MNISTRLLRLLKAFANDKTSQMVEEGGAYLDEILKEWELKHSTRDSSFDTKEKPHRSRSHSDRDSFSQNNQKKQEQKSESSNYSGYSKQILEDLHLFGLKPPVTFEEVKKARNQEIKKFHPDKFLKDPEKMETAKQILQIYNAAYDRLKQRLK